MRAVSDAIAQLGSETSLAGVRATAVAAGNKVCAEYGTWKAAEGHRRACEQMAQWTVEGDGARDAVRQALEKLPVGSPRAKMEHARDSALAPFRAAKKAATDADLYLHNVSGCIEELGDEWDLGDSSERYRLAERLKAKLRPVLIQKLCEENMDISEAHDFIEDWVYRELELDD